jgi:hypothetical protein
MESNHGSIHVAVRSTFLMLPVSSTGEEMRMNISGVTQQAAAIPAANPLRATAQTTQAGTQRPVQDKVTLGAQLDAQLTYTNKVPQSGSDLAVMLEESERKVQAVIDLIRSLVEQQGLDFSKVASGEQRLSADPAAIADAKAAIADGGEFSAEKTAERILSFAKGTIGNDPSKLDSVRAAVEKGFQQAAKMLGGSLPDISQKTLEMVRAQFDLWKNEGITTSA